MGIVGGRRRELKYTDPFWRNDQDGRKEGVELLGAPGARERIQGLEAKAVEQSLKGTRKRERESLLQQSNTEQERIISHPPALGEILIMEVKGNDLFVIMFGMKGEIFTC